MIRAHSSQSTPCTAAIVRSRLGLGLLFLCSAISLVASDALACGGPCNSPEFWSIQPTSKGAVIVSNFGLIERDEAGWIMACEEHIGGLLLDVKSSGNWLVALTDSGVWLSNDGVCTWEQGPTSERSTWFLDSAIGIATDESSPPLLVLANDAVEQNTKLERSNGSVFEIVHSFDPSVAFRNLVTSEDLQRIFVTGYSQGPRTWHLSYSLDAGQTFTDVIPSEVDNALAVMVPRRVDPNDSSRLFLAAQTTSGIGDELWLFDASSNQTQRVLTLEDSEVLSNVAFLDGDVWVAGRRNGAGSLYRANAATLDFTRLVSDAPSLACLEVQDSTLLTCANDYSYESSFLVAEVLAQGTQLNPQMRVPDLAALRACDDSCTATQDWLTTTYGSAPPAETMSPVTSAPVDEPPPDSQPTTPRSSGCGLGPSVTQSPATRSPARYSWLAVAVAVVGLVRRRLPIA